MLSADQKTQFDAQGYLLVEQVLDAATALDPIIDEYDYLLNELATDLFARGELGPGCGRTPGHGSQPLLRRQKSTTIGCSNAC